MALLWRILVHTYFRADIDAFYEFPGGPVDLCDIHKVTIGKSVDFLKNLWITCPAGPCVLKKCPGTHC